MRFSKDAEKISRPKSSSDTLAMRAILSAARISRSVQVGDLNITVSEMMAAAILSDTVMFKSPTCTEKDRRTAERMARIANVSLDELGREIFSASLDSKTVHDLLLSDYKEFHIAGHDLAVAQITCVDSPKILERKEEFLTLMRQMKAKKNFSIATIYHISLALGIPVGLLFIKDKESVYSDK